MHCYGCMTKFSFFTKEYSCPSCGLSYCNKCLKNKVTLGESQKNVCHNCYKKLESISSKMSSSDQENSDFLLKRLEKLENPAKPPITVFRHSSKWTNLRSGLSSQDKEILERLEKLKAERTVPVLKDESEIKRRLALLQDRSEDSIRDKPQSLVSPQKSEQEQVNDLLKMYMDETGMEANLETRGNKAFDEIHERLRKLHMAEGSSSDVNSSLLESDDGDSVTANIIKRAIAEGRLERKLEVQTESDDEDLDISDDNQSEADPDLPWCIICNENATLKCFGCDGSLYCNTCFKQGHEFFDMEDHKFVPFEKKNSSS